MALHLAANGCYGIMVYNNKELNDDQISEEFTKYGKIHEIQKGGKNLLFIYYKHYEEARECLDKLQGDADFNARPAKPRETTRPDTRTYGARSRAKSVCGERSSEEPRPLPRSKSCARINIPPGEEKNEDGDNNNKSNADQNKSDGFQKNRLYRTKSLGENRFEEGFRPRSRSVGRFNLDEEVKRAQLIKKTLKKEGEEIKPNPEKNEETSEEIITKDDNESKKSSTDEKDIILYENEEKDIKSHVKEMLSTTFPPPFKRFEYQKRSGRGRDLWNKGLQTDRRQMSHGYVRPHRFQIEPPNNSRDILPLVYITTIYEYHLLMNMEAKRTYPIVISGLPLYFTEEEIYNLCSPFAEVLKIHLVRSMAPLLSVRAYVFLKNKKDALRLRDSVHKQMLCSHVIIANTLSEIKGQIISS